MTTEFVRQDLDQNSSTTAEPDRVRVIRDGVASYLPDIDPDETAEWLESLDGLHRPVSGPTRARYLMLRLLERAGEQRVAIRRADVDRLHQHHPARARARGSPATRSSSAGTARGSAGTRRSWCTARSAPASASAATSPPTRPRRRSTRSASTTSSAARTTPAAATRSSIQGHASPGMYARAFLEGRLTEDQLDGFRQEKSQPPRRAAVLPAPAADAGVLGVPHRVDGPRPDQRDLPGAVQPATCTNRGIKDTSDQHVWAFLGDGEMDEVESRGRAAAWPPTRGSTTSPSSSTATCSASTARCAATARSSRSWRRSSAAPAGTSSRWSGAASGTTLLAARHATARWSTSMNATPDGDYQTYKAEDGALRPRALLRPRPADRGAGRGLHRRRRSGTSSAAATTTARCTPPSRRRPSTRASRPSSSRKTIKGYGLGPQLRGPQRHPPDEEADARRPQARSATRCASRSPTPSSRRTRTCRRTTTPAPTTPAIQYLLERRRALGGFVPERRTKSRRLRAARRPTPTRSLKKGSGKQEVATTMAFARLLKDLLRAKDFGNRIVPIIPDEARTFGMDAFFPTAKIYNPHGQHYTSVDRELLLAYKESPQGQILHVGINEAGAFAAFTAAGTSYATHGEPLIPVYVFYSMFGFQRTGDAHVGGGRPDGARLRHGRHRRPHHADRRGPAARRRPLAAARVDQPGGGVLRPGLRLRDRRTSCAAASSACTADSTADPNVMYYLTVYNEPLVQPAEPERRRRRRRRCAASTSSSAAERPTARGRSCWRPASACRGRSRRRQLLARGLGRRRPTCGRSPPGPSCAATASPPTSTTSCTPTEPPHGRTSRQKLAGAAGPVRRGQRLHARRAGPDPAVRARRVRDARRRRLRLQRHARRRRGGSSRSTGRRSWCACSSRSPGAARWIRRCRAQAIEKYRLHDVTAGTTGNAGGES